MSNMVIEYLQAVSKLRGDRPSIEALLLKEGVEFTFAPRPTEIPQGTMRECFRNAALLALSHPELIYCEGYAHCIIPTEHAWCVTPQGVVVDPTWEDGSQYFGIPFKTTYLRTTLFKTEIYGLLNNYTEQFPLLRLNPKHYKQRLTRETSHQNLVT